MDSLAFECNYCDGVLCTEHRLPELHDCKALDNPELFRKQLGGQRTKSGEPPRLENIDLKSESHYSEIDVEPMELTREQTVGTTSKSPISDSSPDVAPDGSLVYEDDVDDKEETDATAEQTVGRTMRFVGAIALVVVLAAAAVFVLV